MAPPRMTAHSALLLLLLACVALALGSAETFPRSAADRSAVVAPVVAARTEDLDPGSSTASSSSAAASASSASSATSSSSSSASSSSSSAASSSAASDATELSQFLRGSSGSFGSRGSSSSSSTDVTLESELLPGGANGFGRVTYDDDASSKMVASAFGGMRSGESQAAYRARIRKAQRAAERKNPDLRLQNLVAF